MLDRHAISAITVISAAIVLVACSKADSGAADTGMSTVSAMPADTGMSAMTGMDHSTMSTTPAKDPDQEFTRMMIDHHQGLIAIADTTLAKNPSARTATRANAMKRAQTAEQQKMIGMLKSDYGEDKMAMVMTSNAAMIVDIASKTGPALDRAFREQVIAHHEEALKMIGEYEPKFTKPAVRAMAAKMKSDQQKEITALRAELKAM